MNMDFFFCVLGTVFIIEGLLYLTFPEKAKAYLSKLLDLPDTTLRVAGSMAVITGLVLVYFGRTLKIFDEILTK